MNAALARPLAYENAAALARKASANGFISYENALAVFMDSLPADLSIARRELAFWMERAKGQAAFCAALAKIDGTAAELDDARRFLGVCLANARRNANLIIAGKRHNAALARRSIINCNGGINE